MPKSELSHVCGPVDVADDETEAMQEWAETMFGGRVLKRAEGESPKGIDEGSEENP